MSSNRDQLVLDAIGSRRPNGKGTVRANCPFCEMQVGKTDRNQCLSLNLTNGFYKCFRCDTKGRIDDLPFNIATRPTATPIKIEESVNLPEGFVPLWKTAGEAIVCRPAQKYLADRNISQETINRARIGACFKGFFKQRIIIPIHRQGKLVGFVGRIWKDKLPDGARKYLYNAGFDRAITLYNEQALYVTTDQPVMVVEGVFDTFPFYPDAVACLGKPSEAQVQMLCEANRPIAVVFDGDAWREAEGLAMGLRMRGKNAMAFKMPPGKDPDEMVEEVKERIRIAFGLESAQG